LACRAAAQRLPKRRRQLVLMARGRLSKLINFAKHNALDGLHIVKLVEAELAVIDGNRECAMSKYYESIALAAEANFINVQALACERAALALRGFGDTSSAEAPKYFARALLLYKEWGAMAKVELMRSVTEKHGMPLKVDDSDEDDTGTRGECDYYNASG
jgi:hypothetical protein